MTKEKDMLQEVLRLNPRRIREIDIQKMSAKSIVSAVRETLSLRRKLIKFKSILDTPPLACNPKATTEVHMLTCHKHLYFCILAIKSLLRFYNNVRIVVHDDGTLSSDDQRLLTSHVVGASLRRNTRNPEVKSLT